VRPDNWLSDITQTTWRSLEILSATCGDATGHRVALDEFDALLLAQFPDDPPHASSKLPIDNTAAVLWDKNNVVLEVPKNVRLALPVSHGHLLPSERGSSLKGGSLLHSCARRNGRAPVSLTARGGGLPVGLAARAWATRCATDHSGLTPAATGLTPAKIPSASA
jgi:hypothetical protein